MPRRSTPPAMVPDNDDEPPPSRWDHLALWIEVFGFGVLLVTGTIALAWGAVCYVMGVT